MKLIYISLLIFCVSICFAPHSGIAQEDIRDIPLDSLLNTQISTASKYNQTMKEAPASVTIITSEDIERYGYRTLEDVFAGVRGFYISNDRNYSYVGVRGFGRPTDYNNRILLLIDGHTLNEGVYGSAPLGTEFSLDLNSIERIEIVRGPGSALYGTNAMFAVVNVITKKGVTADGVKFSTTAGSYGKREGTAMFGREFDNGADIFISGQWSDIQGQEELYYEEYDDPSTNKGIAEGLDWDKHYGLLTTATYEDFTLQGIITSRRKGVPTGAWEMLFNDSDAETLDGYGLVELKYHREIASDKNVMLRGYFNHYFYEAAYPYEDALWFDATDDNWLGSEIQFRWDPRSDNRLILGAEYQDHLRADYRYWDENEEYLNVDSPYNILSFYVQDEYQVTRDLLLTLGVRRDAYSTGGDSTNPRAAIVYNPIKSGTLKLLYGQAFRIPNVYEANYAEEDYWVINDNLKPEKIRTAEIVWEQRLSEGLLGSISVYNYTIKDLIDVIELPADPDTEPLFQYQNVNRVKANGLELGVDTWLRMGIRGYANYSLQRAKDPDLDERLSNSPSHIVRFGLICPVLKSLYAALEMHYETERTTVYETETKHYLLTNFNISTRPLLNRLKFSFLARNVFDVKYELPGGFEHLQPAIAQDGRNFAVEVVCSF